MAKNKQIIMLLMFCILFSGAASAVEHYYEIDLRYDHGEITLQSMNIKILTEEIESLGKYSAEVRSVDDKVLSIINFGFSLERLFDFFDPKTGDIIGGYTEYFNKTDFTIEVPYHENAKEINIYDPDGTLKLTIDVSPYSKERVELEEVQEKVLEKVEEKVPAAVSRKIWQQSWPWFLASAIILSVALFLLTRKKKKKKRGG